MIGKQTKGLTNSENLWNFWFLPDRITKRFVKMTLCHFDLLTLFLTFQMNCLSYWPNGCLFQFRYDCRPNIIGWFSNRTGTSVDDGARKSNNWLDQWQSDKLGSGSQVLSFSRAFPSPNDVRVLLLNQPNNRELCLTQQRRRWLQKRHLKSEVAVLETLSRLFHLFQFVICQQYS